MQAEDKNAPMHTSTPAVTARRKKKNFGALEMQSPIKESPNAAQAIEVKRAKVNKDLVLEAVRIVGIDKKGISLQAITKYIGEVRGEKSPDVTLTRVKNQIKKTILTLVEQEMLVRPRGSGAKGVTGLFQVSEHARFPVLKCKPVILERGPLLIKKSQERAKLAETNSKTDTLKKGEKEKLAAEIVTKKPMKKQIPKQTEEKPTKPAKKIIKSKAKVDPVTKSVYSDFEDEVKAGNQDHKRNKEKVDFSDSDEAEENKAPETNVKVRGRIKNEQKTKETSNAKQGISKKGNTKQPETQKPTSKMTKRAQGKDLKPASNLKRKDFSDTEIEVPASFPKPLKSYSSDTELEVSRRMENKKAERVKKHDSNRETTAIKENSAAQNPTKLRKKR